MDAASTPLCEILPHGADMTLIDRLVSYDAERSVAVVEIDEHDPFFEGSGVPAWVGIEYMAQTIAAHAGFAARLRRENPEIGFLLGTRLYSSCVDEFPAGARLTISVKPDIAEGRLASFVCAIETDRVVATAVLNVYRPSAEELSDLRRGMRAP